MPVEGGPVTTLAWWTQPEISQAVVAFGIHEDDGCLVRYLPLELLGVVSVRPRSSAVVDQCLLFNVAYMTFRRFHGGRRWRPVMRTGR